MAGCSLNSGIAADPESGRCHPGATDVTERDSQVARLARANEQLKRSNSDLQHLACGTAHDLKQPLASVPRNAELIAHSQ